MAMSVFGWSSLLSICFESAPFTLNSLFRSFFGGREVLLRHSLCFRSFVGKLGKWVNLIEILRTQYGENILSTVIVFKWNRKFTEGRKKVKNNSHDPPLRTSVIEASNRLNSFGRKSTINSIRNQWEIQHQLRQCTLSIVTDGSWF